MNTSFRRLSILSSTLLVFGCSGLDDPAWHRRGRQDPAALTVPEKWMLKSYVYKGEEKTTTGGGAYIRFMPGDVIGRYDGLNWMSCSSDGPGYKATTDGGFHIIGEERNATAVEADPELQEGISRRDQLLLGATTFECTGNTLVLSDGTERNQLRYLANTR